MATEQEIKEIKILFFRHHLFDSGLCLIKDVIIYKFHFRGMEVGRG